MTLFPYTTLFRSVKKETEKVEKKEQVVEKKKVSNRTIIIVIISLLAIALLGIYLYQWHNVKEEEKLMKSYLLTTDTVSLEIKNLDEVPQILTEAPNEYFVLINYTGNENNYKLEEGLKQIIDSYKFGDCFYYLNVENIMKEDNYLARLNTAFNTDKITVVPTILYYKNNEIVDVVKRIDGNPINAGDFQKLLDIYEFEGQ